MKEEIVREIMEEDYQKLKKALNKKDDYFKMKELEAVQNLVKKLT